MSLQMVLENWSEYESRKMKNGPDEKRFICTEPWEVNYLIDRIKKVYRTIPSNNIHKAIILSCRESPILRERKAFVKRVLNKLGIFA